MSPLKIYADEDCTKELGEHSVHFGIVDIGQSKTVELWLKNEGKRTVQGIEVYLDDEDCKVTGTPEQLPPGDKARLSVTWRPSSKYVKTDSPLKSQLRVRGNYVVD